MMFAKLPVGNLNSLEALFSLEAFPQIILEAVRVPELGSGAIGLMNGSPGRERLRGAEHTGM